MSEQPKKSRGHQVIDKIKGIIWTDNGLASLIDAACDEAVAEAFEAVTEKVNRQCDVLEGTFRRDLAKEILFSHYEWEAEMMRRNPSMVMTKFDDMLGHAIRNADKFIAAVAAPKEAVAIYHSSRGKGSMLCGASGVLFMADSPAAVTCPKCLALMGGGK